MIIREKWLEETIDRIQGAVWWNELVLQSQIADGFAEDKLDTTKVAIEKDTKTLNLLKDELTKLKSSS